jgi:hypothetical protein
VFDKPEGAMHDWEIFREIALRTAARLTKKKPLSKTLVERVSLSLSPTVLVTALLALGRRTSMRALRANPAGVDLGPLRPTMPGRLQTKDKLIHLAPDLVIADLARLRASIQAPVGDELLLIGRRHQRDNNSWMHNSTRLTRGRTRHQLLMHPDDLAARGLSDGAPVLISSRVGKVTTEVRATDDMMPGVVSLPHGYGHQVGGTRMAHAATVPGVSINDLTDPERLDVSGNAALSGVPVTVSAG